HRDQCCPREHDRPERREREEVDLASAHASKYRPQTGRNPPGESVTGFDRDRKEVRATCPPSPPIPFASRGSSTRRSAAGSGSSNGCSPSHTSSSSSSSSSRSSYSRSS